ncbi:hypothetical protein BJ138DRAFT_1157028 [Hygrophoropsis aurantiaca]|uniref:Uncharacterized protein n=1 Tax=Hygrophoropsis aurantiaca TaxID=72124 RepID=A0ACB8A5Q7_9AGAM|nr:hypothetical protein BJ138DRAFT_1157028 [Hygrophoropsis aurantiaca]
MSTERAPFRDGMQLGQGFNTFTQQTCANGVVDVVVPEPTISLKKEYKSVLIDNYEKLVKSLDVSASATVTGWGQTGKVDAEFLSRSEYESSDVTYLVQVNVQHQPTHTSQYTFKPVTTTNPHETYGDRWISDFVKGGYFYARFSLRSINRKDSEEIKQSATVAFSMYGGTGEVSESVKSAIESIVKKSEIRIVKRQSGGGGTALSAPAAAGDNTLMSIKAEADQFYQDADKHKYLRYAILSKYENLKDFNGAFKPFDYAYATKKSWQPFDEFTKYTTLENMVKNIPDQKYRDGSSQKTNLRDRQINEMNKIRDMVLKISDDPSKVDASPTYLPSSQFRAEVLAAVKTVTYIAQRINIDDDNWTDTALPSLKPGAKKLFEFTCYDFPEVQDTTVVSFGSGKDGYIALINNRVSTDDWNEESHFWIFKEMISKVSETQIDVSRLHNRNHLRLTQGNARGNVKKLFSFHAGKV